MSVYLPEFMQKLSAERAAEAAQLSRRGFIKLTGLAGGGLVLALSFGPAAKKALAQPSGAQAFNANPYVQVQPDGKIVLFAKNPEVGQGVKTSLPLIVAEELDADWTQVEVRQSVIDAALYGPQFAGGSLSIPMNFDVLRRAGATARAMLVAAAAKTWNVPVAELTTENSAVRHAASNRSASYGELAELAATMPVPSADSVALKSKESFRLLGKRFTGVDNAQLVRGEPLFGIDQRVPGMVYATYAKAPAIGARAVSANLDEIRKLPGVKNAFIVGGQGDAITFNPAAAAVLSGVAIVGDSTWAALQAKKALKVQWDDSAASSDSWTGPSRKRSPWRRRRRSRCSVRRATWKPHSPRARPSKPCIRITMCRTPISSRRIARLGSRATTSRYGRRRRRRRMPSTPSRNCLACRRRRSRCTSCAAAVVSAAGSRTTACARRRSSRSRPAVSR